MKNELKPCPFCGSKAQLIQYETKTKETWFGVRCSNYDCIGNDISPEFSLETPAVNWWNMRKKDDGFTAQKWIPVTERLPESQADVLVVAFWHENWQTMIGWHSDFGKKWRVVTPHGEFEPGGVTHWMPLPEPPKEVE